jgi:hypothetical protein
MVEAFAAQRPDEALGDRVRPRCPDWGADDADVGAGEDGGDELGISVADQEPELLDVVAEVHQEVAGLLGDPGAGGVGGDPGEVYVAAAVLDHHEHVEAAQDDGVDVGEVDREDRPRVRGEELAPARPGGARSGIDPGDPKDLPHRRRGDLVAESDQFAVDASVSPSWVFPGQPQHQRPDGLRDGWPARLSSWVGPSAGDQLGCQYRSVLGDTSRSWRTEVGSSLLSAVSRARSAQLSVGRGLRRRSTATLVTHRQDLDVLGFVGAGKAAPAS